MPFAPKRRTEFEAETQALGLASEHGAWRGIAPLAQSEEEIEMDPEMNSPGNATAGETRPASLRGGRTEQHVSALVGRLAGMVDARAARLARARARLLAGEIDCLDTLRDTAARFLDEHRRGD